MIENFRWEEMQARTGDALAASRELLKDAGAVTRWARKVRSDVQRRRDAQQTPEGQQSLEAPQEPNAVSPEEYAAASSEEYVLVARLQRDLDLAQSPQLSAWLRSLADTGPAGRATGGVEAVVVDLRDVKLIDGSGLSSLVSGHRALAGIGLRLAVLLAPGSQPERVFRAASLGKIILALGSLDEMDHE